MSENKEVVKPIVIPYTPRKALSNIHNFVSESEESCLIIHRRAGKTVSLINQLIKKALQFNRNDGEFAYIAPFLKQAKRLSWKYLKYYCSPLPDIKFSESELCVVLPNKSRIGLYGADNSDALRGIYLDGGVLDEYSDIDPDVYESILSPALLDRDGWVAFSGTPNGRNHLYDKYMELRSDPKSYTILLKASESGILTPEQLIKARKRCRTQEKYDREYECSFDSVSGKKIYPEFNFDTHVAKYSLLPDSATLIIRGWDNTGLYPAVVLTYFTGSGQWRIFKEFKFEDVDIRDATEAVIFWCNLNLPKGCKYRDISDPAGGNRDSIKMSAKTYIMLKARECGQDIRLEDGIQNTSIRWASVAGRLNRVYGGEPAILIDPSCKHLIEGFMGAYAYKTMVSLPGVFLKKADKSKPCADVHDALQYPATLLFLSSDNIRQQDIGKSLSLNSNAWDEEDCDYIFNDNRIGRSQLAGY